MSDVNTPSAAAKAMHDAACLPRALMGGTKAMRAAKTTYLPMEAAETADAYAARLGRTTLFNAFRKTVKDMTGKVFRREIVLGADVPAALETYAENIDLAGRHLNVFARDCFFDAMQPGIGFIFTDMPPPVKRADGKPATRADENAAGIRPYLCYIKVEDVLGWQTATIGGVVTLTQFRFRETVTEPDGAFATKVVPQVRVLYPGRWEVWREATDGADKGKWVKGGEGLTSIQKIAIAPIYMNRTGFMTAEPPLEDLADLNVAHWQSQSDQRNILHVARVPILFGKGFQEGDTIEIGASRMVRSSSTEADMKFVEHTGKAIEAGDKDLQNLEFQMQTQGLQLLVPQPGGKTATGEIHDDEKENSPLAMMANALGDALEQSFGFMAEFIGAGSGGSLTVNTDFGISAQATQTIQYLLDAVNSGQISRETFWSELKRRDILAESFDLEVEKDRLATQPPSLDAGAGKGMNLNGATA